MNRPEFQAMAEERVVDARVLLAGGQWSAAYYLAGYAVECGLKACIVRRVEAAAGVIFEDRKFSDEEDLGWNDASGTVPGMNAGSNRKKHGEPCCPWREANPVAWFTMLFPIRPGIHAGNPIRRDNRPREWSDAMDQSPLVNEEIEAGAEFLREFANYTPIEFAFWLRPDSNDRCDLYIVSDQIENDSSRQAIREVNRITEKLDDPHLESLLVRFVRSDDKRAKAAAELRRRYPNAKAIHYRNKNFAGRDTDEFYLYPPLNPAPVS